jgi:hypothetical protein
MRIVLYTCTCEDQVDRAKELFDPAFVGAQDCDPLFCAPNGIRVVVDCGFENGI